MRAAPPFFNFLRELTPRKERAAFTLADALILAATLWAAYALRLGELIPPDHHVWGLMALVPLLTVPVFAGFGLYRAVTRYMGGHAIWTLVKGVSISALLVAAVALFLGERGIPRTVIVLYWALALLATGGLRLVVRHWFRAMLAGRAQRKRVIIYGAGSAGVQVAPALLHGQEFEPVAFIDDDPALQGSVLHGLRVHAPENLAHVAEQYAAQEILLALPSVGRERRRQILRWLEPLDLHVRTLPSLADLMSGRARVDEFREVEAEDLLGREPVPPDRQLLEAGIAGQTVLVTGAGGSIGAELCRQIVALNPHTLILLDISEYGLYQVERQVQAIAASHNQPTRIETLLGSAGDRHRLHKIMAGFHVQTVFHAAAYKHVPQVERNLVPGVENNTLGTLHAARAAIDAGVGSFVLISTDKAVRPTNIMGASKRLAEIAVQALASQQPPTRFSIVRFGNVLGSSGSVVPLFRDQIRAGGPVTVTHPDVVRYFMTISEAVELVLQAEAIGDRGAVFVLDMGEPVRIQDLARRMIRLSGFHVRQQESPDGDIAIQFTGLRPGEKLYEELVIGDSITETDHPMIMRAREGAVDPRQFRALIDTLQRGIQTLDCNLIRQTLLSAVDGFAPQDHIHDALWQQSNGHSKITETNGNGHANANDDTSHSSKRR